MTFTDFIAQYPDHVEEVTERAAIMEYHGNLSREEAEQKAVDRVLEKIERQLVLFDGDK